MENEVEKVPCGGCGTAFDPWASKSKGQKFPFKSCFNCKQKAGGGAPMNPNMDERFDKLGEFLVKEFEEIKEMIRQASPK